MRVARRRSAANRAERWEDVTADCEMLETDDTATYLVITHHQAPAHVVAVTTSFQLQPMYRIRKYRSVEGRWRFTVERRRA